MKRAAGPLMGLLVMMGLLTLAACSMGAQGDPEPVTVTLEKGDGYDTLVFDPRSSDAVIGEQEPVVIHGLGLQVNDPEHCQAVAPDSPDIQCHFGTVRTGHPYALPVTGWVQTITGKYSRTDQATLYPLAWP